MNIVHACFSDPLRAVKTKYNFVQFERTTVAFGTSLCSIPAATDAFFLIKEMQEILKTSEISRSSDVVRAEEASYGPAQKHSHELSVDCTLVFKGCNQVELEMPPQSPSRASESWQWLR